MIQMVLKVYLKFRIYIQKYSLTSKIDILTAAAVCDVSSNCNLGFSTSMSGNRLIAGAPKRDS